MIEKYLEKSELFFDILVRSEYCEVREAFLAMMRECVLKCAIEASDNPAEGVGLWSGGKISICREWVDGVKGALVRAKGKANPDAEAGLAYPPI